MIITTLLYILFVLAAGILIVVILLQEGKGGGFGQALGEHGQQTFGVGAKGINTFTGWTAAIFLMSAVVLHNLNRESSTGSAIDAIHSVNSNPNLPDNYQGALGPSTGGAGSTPANDEGK